MQMIDAWLQSPLWTEDVNVTEDWSAIFVVISSDGVRCIYKTKNTYDVQIAG